MVSLWPEKGFLHHLVQWAHCTGKQTEAQGRGVTCLRLQASEKKT